MITDFDFSFFAFCFFFFFFGFLGHFLDQTDMEKCQV